MTVWEEVSVPKGAYIGWGKIGQKVVGRVLNFELEGGTDFNDKPCPLLELELIEPADSYNKSGEQSSYGVGDLICITAGQVSLKRALKKADPEKGDLIKIEFTSEARTKNGTVKEFTVQVARGAGGSASSSASKSAPAEEIPEGFSAEEWAALSDQAKDILLKKRV